MTAGVELTESGRVAGIVMDFPAEDLVADASSSSPPPKLTRRLRRRLLEARSPSTAEEIEAKLREANLRRQQFHEWLSNKARPKPKSPSWSSFQDEDLGQRLEAKLYAAEQKRLSILAKAQMRLARLDRLRQAAKIGVEMRYEKEREELGTKVESRVQQAEANRMLLLNAYRQRRAAEKERTTQSLLRKMVQESKYKECVRAAISHKRAAAEAKRLGFLEAEKTRARARVLQVQRVANSVYHQREVERRMLKDKLEDRLQRAKRRRAEYLRQRGGFHGSVHANCNKMHKKGDLLSRKLARCWRRFLKLKRTTFSLAKAYNTLEINEKSIMLMPFEQLALQIESPSTLQTVKALLDRFESWFTVSCATSNPSSFDNIDHLLRCLGSPVQRCTRNNTSKGKGAKQVVSNKEADTNPVQLSRYPARVVLCAYMILGHPDAVFSGQGEHEIALADCARKFVQEFEMLIKIVLDGPTKGSHESVRSQLATFDAAWCSYLYLFVVWKVKDAKPLEEDLVRAACQLELSMMQACKMTPEGDSSGLTHDMKAIQKQVTEDKRFLRETIQRLSGNAGIKRLECALSDMRSRFFEAKENGSQSVSPIISSLDFSSSSAGSSFSVLGKGSKPVEADKGPNHVVHSLFENVFSSAPRENLPTPFGGIVNGQPGSSSGESLFSENELLVHEIVHEHHQAFIDNLSNKDQSDVKEKIRETMEKAFWDGITESMKQDKPNYNRVVELMKEVRDELCDMAPHTWRQEILESIDLDILSEALMSEIQDMDFFRKILEFALTTLLKLSSPAAEDEMKETYKKLLKELNEISQSGEKSSFVIAMIKGLRFVLEQIQELKREISKAHIRIAGPLIKGPTGLEYLKKAFANRYRSPSDASTALPLTVQWLSSVKGSSEQEWGEHTDSLSASRTSQISSSQGLPPTLRTGGSVLVSSNRSQGKSFPSVTIATFTGNQQPECKGERIDLLVRLGLLKLVFGTKGLTLETLPETLKLNLSRLKAVQSQLQKSVVIAISMLVLRQILISENLVTSATEMEKTVYKSVKELFNLLDRVADVGVAEIIDAIDGFSGGDNFSDAKKIQARREVMANMLVRSLRAEDVVFMKVSHAIYLAMRGVVLGGSGLQGRELAELALGRVGATILIDNIIEAGEVLVVVATVSISVHGLWYAHLI
ncbi:PREDICTED: uncharacterized protein LOC104589040 isoform X1 [Nelumbo nucifera]|uniref:Uncharacterized protein LOC104589040 isoform X1 n=2 Tax=Nelumbo nucifera TaxID=4432 RepID=A0A1U7ZCB4_NELNU|nr:PREDICTED: uncharacterized protein LOC104589040 isoform X1 [Nelumbo nucifera]DAD39049.1 TPA_asm: hypothetical protein HUJ06_013372 [Nelumbo nucifera]